MRDSTPPSSRSSQLPAAPRFVPVRHTRFDDYTIVGHLASGGMADVYLALREGSSGFLKLEVVKFLNLSDPEYIEMFLDEARLAALLDHPNIVQTHRASVHEGRHFLVMEYLEGVPLSRLMRVTGRRSPLPIPLVVHLATEVVSGLEYAHNATSLDGTPLRIVHRDVSPNNIFVTSQGVVKLLDFGIARASNRESTTQAGVVRGKLAYISPEQARGQDVDHRADIYSLGVVLWEMLTGCRLFKGENDADTIRKALAGEVAPPSSVRGDVPQELDEIVMRALARHPSDRYPSTRHLRAALEALRRKWGSVSAKDEWAGLVTEHFQPHLDELRRTIKQAVEVASGESRSSSYPGLTSSPSLVPPERRRPWLWVLVAALAATLSMTAVLFLPGWVVSGRGDLEAVQLLSFTTPAAATAAPRAQHLDPLAVSEPKVTPASSELIKEVRVKEVQAALRARWKKSVSSGKPAEAADKSDQESGSGFLTIDTAPWSEVRLGGRKLGVTPLVGVALPSGRHTLELRNPELGLVTQYTVQIDPGQTAVRKLGIN